MTKRNVHQWTKDEVKKVIELWPDFGVTEIATGLNVTVLQLSAIVRLIRLAGHDLPKKTSKSSGRYAVEAALSELKRSR